MPLAANLQNFRNTAINFARSFHCSGNYEGNGFFKPYASVNDLRHNVKAIFFRPLIHAYLIIDYTLNALLYLGVGLINVGFGLITCGLEDIKAGGKNVLNGGAQLIVAVCAAISMILDPLDAILRLLSHSLTTIGLGLGFGLSKAGEYLAPMMAAAKDAVSHMTGGLTA